MFTWEAKLHRIRNSVFTQHNVVSKNIWLLTFHRTLKLTMTTLQAVTMNADWDLQTNKKQISSDKNPNLSEADHKRHLEALLVD